jgi:hypothetical protein
MTCRLVGDRCSEPGCDRPVWKDGVCSQHWHLNRAFRARLRHDIENDEWPGGLLGAPPWWDSTSSEFDDDLRRWLNAA